MEKMMEKTTETHTIQQAPPQPPPQIVVNVPAAQPCPLPPPPPPPPPPMISSSLSSSTSSLTKEDLQQMMQNMQSSKGVALPPVPPPNPEIAQLRQLLEAQHQAPVHGPPMVLPPPHIEPHHIQAERDIVAPPPPPPPMHTQEDLTARLRGMIPQPARIPAPPVFNITQAAPVVVQPCLNCGSPPPEARPEPTPPKCDRQKPDDPGCKEEPPKHVKCKRNKSALKVIGEGDFTIDDFEDDEDCEPDLALDKPEPECKEPDCDGIKKNEFNPSKLLARLCTGGKCPDIPGVQKLGPRPHSAQTGA